MACQDLNIYNPKNNCNNKKNSKTNIKITSNCNNMGNTKKNCNSYLKLNGWSLVVFIQYPLLFQNLTDLQGVLEKVIL